MIEDRQMRLAEEYRKLAYARFAYHYFALYESLDEGYMENPYTDYAGELDVLNRSAAALLSGRGGKETLDELKTLRRSNIRQVELLTAYTDSLRIYEYVLNRIEFRFEEADAADARELAQDVFQFIFQDKDNPMIYDRLSLVLSQLPVRMTKARFADLIRASFSVYKGGTRESFDAFAAYLRQIAMLDPLEEKPEFRDISAFFDRCGKTDYRTIGHQEFHQMQDELVEIAHAVEVCADGYMQIQELCNVCVVIALTDGLGCPDSGEISVCRAICREINESFASGRELKEMEELLAKLEGVQERNLERITRLESRIEEKIPALAECERLMGSSIFAEEPDEPDERTVDDAYFLDVSERFIAELSERMRERPKQVNRAVMALILSNIPNVFSSQEEIYEYILYALSSASPEEQKASEALLVPILAED